MKKIHFVFGLHNHQPVGNFESVFEDAYAKSYLPFIEVLERHPRIRVAQHYTGILFDWLVRNRPEFVARLRRLVEAGQVEMMTGGFYEPILSVIPERDRLAQIRSLTGFVKEHTGADAQGAWLAERVWEPQLTRSMVDAGVKYTVLDDSHFKATGLEEAQTYGYFTTDDTGRAMAIFPISEKLRYTIPFQPAEATIEFLRSIATEDGTAVAVMADDGEKFGVWPNTYEHCYEKGWLESFFTALEANADWIHMTTFSDVLASVPPLGRIYLPTASYIEMMEWAMPAQAIVHFEEFVHQLRDEGKYEGNKTFVRGGFWRNFFAKYDESNHMHKRMISISQRLERLEDGGAAKDATALAAARDHLMAGQCNCAYWHGVFGGLYLCNLRHGIYENLVKADAELDRAEFGARPFAQVVEADFDADLRPETIARTDRHTLIIKPDQGGQVIEHDWKPRALNVTNTLTRRFEAYHKKVAEAVSPEEAAKGGGTKSIHDLVIAKEANLSDHLLYDWHRRSSLVDHFPGAGADLESFYRAQFPEDGDFVNRPYAATSHVAGDRATVRLVRDGHLFVKGGPHALRVEKTITLVGGSDDVKIDYLLRNMSGVRLKTRFGVEFVANLLAGDAPDRYYLGIDPAVEDNKLRTRGVQSGVGEFGMADEWMNVRLAWAISRPTDVWRVPIETVSLSEAGFERVFQGSAMMPVWSIDMAPGAEWTVTIEHSLAGVREFAGV